MQFNITKDQKEKIDEWLKYTVYPDVIAAQKKLIPETDGSYWFYESCWKDGYPYEGAIGGGITYRFSPNSIGVNVIIEYDTMYETYTLDITDYASW